MKTAAYTLAAAAGTASAQQSMYGKCGGKGYSGATDCVSGAYCHTYNDYYAQCIAGTATSSGVAAPTGTSPASESECGTVTITLDGPSPSASTATTAAPSSAPVVSSSAVAPVSSIQAKPTSSAAPASSVVSSAAATTSYPEQTSVPTFSSTVDKVVTTSSSSKAATTSTSSQAATTSISSKASTTTSASAATSSASSGSGKVAYGGVSVSGFDFGCSTDGTCTVSGVTDPGQDGIDQMKHFVNDDGLNAFRLPVGWQYLVNDVLGGTLDSTYFGNYDALVQGCLGVADLCVLDLHNYARFSGQIVGQGGPTNAEFTSLWSQLATKYADEPKVAFGIMNEPHDVDIDTWAETVQAAVTAIRQAGATSQMILLPGNDWSHALSSVSDGSAAALNSITNLDGSITNLIYDVHQYLDSDGSGTSTECTTDNVAGFKAFGTWLRENGRQALLTETGGGNTDSCYTDLCAELDQLNADSDVYLGWIGWGAGEFDSSYALAETPTLSGGVWTDQPIVSKCIAGKFA